MGRAIDIDKTEIVEVHGAELILTITKDEDDRMLVHVESDAGGGTIRITQHEEDSKRGDITLSIKLGIRGTFLFAASVFLVADLCFIFYYVNQGTVLYAVLFEIMLLPMAVYFIQWFVKVLKNPGMADYTRTMNMNLISSTCLNIFFLITILF